MHAALLLIGSWALAFVTLCAAILLLNIYYQLIGNDLALRSLGQEAAIAGIASLIEGVSAWVILSFLPAAVRAMIIPALIVAVIYKLSHLEDWNKYDIALLLLFQVVIACSGGFLFSGHFQIAIATVVVFGAFLALIGSVVRSL